MFVSGRPWAWHKELEQLADGGHDLILIHRTYIQPLLTVTSASEHLNEDSALLWSEDVIRWIYFTTWQVEVFQWQTCATSNYED